MDSSDVLFDPFAELFASLESREALEGGSELGLSELGLSERVLSELVFSTSPPGEVY